MVRVTVSYMSTKKLQEIENQLKDILQDTAKTNAVLEVIKAACKYTDESTYGDSHRKYYDVHKDELNKKRTEDRRKKKAAEKKPLVSISPVPA